MKLTKDFWYVVAIAVLIALCGQLYFSGHGQLAQGIRVYYNQDTQANQQIIGVIQRADKFVYFAVYTFTRQDIKDALLGAKHRGLEVRGLTDANQLGSLAAQQKIIKALEANSIPVATQDHSGIMHLKAVVTDKEYASGSYNWTAAATSLNDEVLEVGADPQIRASYEKILRQLLNKYAKQ